MPTILRRSPSLAFSDIYGSDVVYNARRPISDEARLGTPQQLDTRVGHLLPIAGAMPVICPRTCSSPSIRALLRRAGLPNMPPLVSYNGREEYMQVLQQLADDGRKVVFQYVCDADSYPESLFWIDRRIAAELNDKGNLPQLVPDRYVPSRSIIPIRELDRLLRADFSSPIVLKAVGPCDRGNGSAMAILRCPADLVAAIPRLSIGVEVIQEQYLDEVHNYCITFAAGHSGVHYLGASDQITDSEGGFHGNWIDLHNPPPREAVDVGFEIMRRAVDRGYVGMAGFDMIVDRDGRLWVIDLNFRLNASTGANLWRDALFADSGCSVAKTVKWTFPGPMRAAMTTLTELIDSRLMFPLKMFDPHSVGEAGEAEVFGLLLGHSRQEVERTHQQIAARLPGGGGVQVSSRKRAG